MKKCSRVMCAVDFSGPSRAAFQHALAIAKSRNSELNVVLAVPLNVRFNRQGRQRAALLSELRRAAAADGVDMTVSVQQGNPASVILLHANSSNSPSPPDLIVLGTHGRKGLDRVRFGSVASRVLQRAPCPTLIVRAAEAGSQDTPVRRFQRILCAIDFSPASMSALNEALRLTRHNGAALEILHVVNRTSPTIPRLACEFAGVDFTQDLTGTVRKRLERLLPLSLEPEGRVHTQVRVGSVEDEIARAASDMHADLIVAGVTSRGRLARLFASTSVRLVRAARCAVLAVPHQINAEAANRGDWLAQPIAA